MEQALWSYLLAAQLSSSLRPSSTIHSRGEYGVGDVVRATVDRRRQDHSGSRVRMGQYLVVETDLEQ